MAIHEIAVSQPCISQICQNDWFHPKVSHYDFCITFLFHTPLRTSNKSYTPQFQDCELLLKQHYIGFFFRIIRRPLIARSDFCYALMRRGYLVVYKGFPTAPVPFYLILISLHFKLPDTEKLPQGNASCRCLILFLEVNKDLSYSSFRFIYLSTWMDQSLPLRKLPLYPFIVQRSFLFFFFIFFFCIFKGIFNLEYCIAL